MKLTKQEKEMNRKKWTKEMLDVLRERYPIHGPTVLSKELGLPYCTVCISSRDESSLEFIHKELEATRPSRHKSERREDRTGGIVQTQSILSVCSKMIANKLVELGMKPRKNYNDDPFPQVPDEVMP